MHVLSLISLVAPAAPPPALRAQYEVQVFKRTFKTEQRNFRSSSQGLACFLRRSSPRTISTDQLHTLLRFHLRPINQIVFLGPYSLKDERSHLRGSFTLRCFQRLSRPYIATQLCPWQDNWCTRGTVHQLSCQGHSWVAMYGRDKR